MSNSRVKYLQYFYPHELITGSNHQLFNLFALLAEASILDRVAIVPDLTLAEFHNNGKPIITRYSKYLDLSNCRDIVSLIDPETFDELTIESYSYADEYTPTNLVQDNSSELLIRKFDHGVFVAPMESDMRVKDAFYQLRSLSQPSEQIRNISQTIKGQLGSYNVIHVRRGDMLKQPWWKFPGVDKGTRPRAIHRRVSQWFDEGCNVYIMSDEVKKDFFDPLSEWYRIYTYHCFQELVEIQKDDNFLLYEIEKTIAEQAIIRVEMFSEYPQYGKFECSLFDYPRTGTTDLPFLIIQRLIHSIGRIDKEMRKLFLNAKSFLKRNLKKIFRMVHKFSR
jgi:hypothetical protein